MTDAIGNTIREGDLLSVSPDLLKHFTFTVIKVQEGGIDTPHGKTPGVLAIAVTMPIENPKAPLMDFRCLRNPQSEALVAAIADGQVKRN